MIITVDGAQGAGKTTLSRKLADKTGLPIVGSFRMQRILMYLYDMHAKGRNEHAKVLSHAFAYAVHGKLHPLGRIQDGTAFNFFSTLYVHDPDNMRELINLYRSCLKYCGLGEPTASFYLAVDFAVSKRRYVNRKASNDPMFRPIIDLEIEELDTSHRNDASYAAHKTLEDYIPYYHVIDGEQDAESVYADVLAILRQKGAIDG